MSADLHIDDFYKDAAIALLQLYSSFPRKITLYVEDVCGPDEPDEFGVHSQRFLSCFGALVWLSEQGYLGFESTIRQEAIDQATLSHKAFLMLSSRSHLETTDTEKSELPDEDIPAAVQELAQTHVAQLRQAVRSRSSSRIRRCMHYLLATSSVYQ